MKQVCGRKAKMKRKGRRDGGKGGKDVGKRESGNWGMVKLGKYCNAS